MKYMSTKLLCISLLALIWQEFALAEEDLQCGKGINQISDDVQEILILSSAPTPQMVTKTQNYIESCRKKSQSFPPGKREDFAKLLEESIKILQEVELTLASEAIGNIADTQLVTKNKEKIEALKIVRQSLILTQRTLKHKIPMDKGWGETFSVNYYLGYEGTTVSGLNEKGTARTGLMVYNQLTTPFKNNEKFKVGFHVFGDAYLTSSAEQSEQSVDSEVKSAIELNINMYIPISIKPQEYGILVIGPIASLSIRKIDGGDEFTRKYYGGIRIAHSPESFLDILYGKTESVDDHRVELKGQLPVAEILKGNIFVGGAANLGVSNNADNTDTLRMYIQWQVQFSDIFSI